MQDDRIRSLALVLYRYQQVMDPRYFITGVGAVSVAAGAGATSPRCRFQRGDTGAVSVTAVAGSTYSFIGAGAA